MKQKRALREAIRRAGGQSALARQLGVRQQNVSWWLLKSGHCPAEYAVQIERLTGVSRQLLRPDVFHE